jgi:hypothetical protein
MSPSITRGVRLTVTLKSSTSTQSANRPRYLSGLDAFEAGHRETSPQVLHKIGATAPVEQMLKDAGIDYVFFDKVAPNPTIEQVRNATDLPQNKWRPP